LPFLTHWFLKGKTYQNSVPPEVLMFFITFRRRFTMTKNFLVIFMLFITFSYSYPTISHPLFFSY